VKNPGDYAITLSTCPPETLPLPLRIDRRLMKHTLSRRTLSRRIGTLSMLAVFAGCVGGNMTEAKKPAPAKAHVPAEGDPPVGVKVELSADEWRKKLDDEQFHVLREQGTERAFTGKYWDHKDDGVYRCAGCGAPLFDSDTKFKSGTGWPSFYQPIEAGRVATETDNKFGMTRVEVHCARCGGHLGHLFGDGPQPTGDRFCINSASLHFDDDDD